MIHGEQRTMYSCSSKIYRIILQKSSSMCTDRFARYDQTVHVHVHTCITVLACTCTCTKMGSYMY